MSTPADWIRATVRASVEGRPPALPAQLDRFAERWASLPSRARLAVGVAGALVVLLAAGSGAARSPWGPPVEVLVATRDLPVGHRIGPQDLTPTSWPRDLAPSSPGDVEGRMLTAALPAGMPVTDGHLDDGGLTAQLRPGEAAFPLPLEEGADLQAGQVVDLVAGDAGGGGSRLSAAARVLTVDGPTAWIAVDRDDAPGLAGAAAWGRVVAVPLAVDG